ncbi:MAG: hypothetical protein DWQ01_14690 [Planctomycetota bacterium]|nr:MAG: hypothetical protein DWQ01_14690 [Planctomycetota bacterium]
MAVLNQEVRKLEEPMRHLAGACPKGRTAKKMEPAAFAESPPSWQPFLLQAEVSSLTSSVQLREGVKAYGGDFS